MSAERDETSLEDRVADLENAWAEFIAAAESAEHEDSSRAIHRAFVARIRERERQA